MPLIGELVFFLIYTRQGWDPPSSARPSGSGWGHNNRVISVCFSYEPHIYIRVTGEDTVLHKTASLHDCVCWGDWVKHPERFSAEEPSRDPFYKILPRGAGLLAQPQTSGESKPATKLVKIIGSAWEISFWQCSPFPKHSHITTLFQPTEENSELGIWTNSSSYSFVSLSLTQSQASLPMLCPCTFTVFPAGLVRGNFGRAVTSGLLLRPQPHKLFACSRHSSARAARWLPGNLQICTPGSPRKVLPTHAHWN